MHSQRGRWERENVFRCNPFLYTIPVVQGFYSLCAFQIRCTSLLPKSENQNYKVFSFVTLVNK
jgi:hypothetical protein